MVAVGVLVLLTSLGLAAVGYLTLVALWQSALDPGTAVLAVVVAGLLAGYLSYRFGTTTLLSRLEAVELPRSRAPELYRRLDRLEARMGVETPTLLVARLPAPNAFAIGTARNGVIVLDRSLLRVLSVDELEALLAHELAHLEGYDAFVQTLAFGVFRTVAGVAFLLASPLLVAIVGLARSVAWIRGRPSAWTQTAFGRFLRWIERGVQLILLFVTLLVRAHSRRREYAADDRAVDVTGNPLALARALRKIQRVADPRRGLLSPLYVHTEEDDWTRLFSTHPSTDDRIERLVERAHADRRRSSHNRRT
ncbi:M48 family metalloprotease [Natronolimnohabitans sp. A-GB9]|uniref:M48 family metallopeptidase n=1 Tax=Natronolimnohabitans sp. A-GB9 TaxID=3069757 RepID=UPI0027AF7CB4|nr:M48 family metalloprotease [Natronolimnohabitans sp. A-GB9]MDQ2051882.1 M48 family metalloprotease [Natronolimnohabitans sp. A-GB9]